MAAPGLVLVHSPLLGAFCWQKVAARLCADGYVVIVADFASVLFEQPPFYPKIARAIAKDAEEASGDIVLVGHSGAGALLPIIAMTIGRRVRGLLFVDAILPHPGKAWLDTVPPDFATRLKALSSDGFLPPWHEWWPSEVMARLVPDRAVRKNFVGNLDRQPLEYFAEIAPEVELSALVKCGYLQLSSAYETEAATVRSLGWPVDYCPLGHLAMVTDPDSLARHIARLVTDIGP
jgi:hypothetical protein